MAKTKQNYDRDFSIGKLEGLKIVLGVEDDYDDIDDTLNLSEAYVTDLFGKIHMVTDKKVETVRLSMEYWRGRQDTSQGKKFYNNMKHLYQQLLLFRESSKATI